MRRREWRVQFEVVVEAETATAAAQEARRYLDTTVSDLPARVQPVASRSQLIWTASTVGDNEQSGTEPDKEGRTR